jgi:Ser/Thr protein kinase RdoA (MazF antagonist)
MSWFTENDNIQKQLENIALYFGLGQVLSIKRLEGYANKNYIVTTTTGEFIVKIVLNRTRVELEQEQIFTKRLEEHAFPAAYYLQSPHGSLCYQDENILAVVLEKKEGRVPEKSEPVNHELGAQLARLHLIPTEGLPTKTSWMNPSYLPDVLEVATQHLEQEEVERFLRVYEQIRHFQPALLPQSIIHGDVVPPNCLFLDTQLTALLDWEEVTIGASILDLAMGVLLFCSVERRFQQNLFVSLLDGYTSIRPLTEDEHDQLAIAVKYVGLSISTYFLLQFMLYYPDDQLKAMRTFYWDFQLDTWTLNEL